MYIAIFSISTAILYIAEKLKEGARKKVLVFIALLIPSIIAGLRDYSIGADVLLYGNYWFERACSYDSLFAFLKKASEYSIASGYATVNYLVSRISHNPHMFYFVYELILMYIVYKAVKPFKEQVSIPFAFLIFFFSYYNSSLNILRQIMAIVLVLYSFQFVVNRKLIRFILVILLAASFHDTAIVAFIIYPLSLLINSKRYGRINEAIIILMGIMALIFFDQIYDIISKMNFLSQRYDHYLTDESSGGRIIRIVYWAIIFILFLIKSKRCAKSFEHTRTLFIITSISFLATFLNFFLGAWAIRIVYYFDVLSVITLPVIAKNMGIKDKKWGNIPSYALILAITAISWLITYVIRSGGGTYPYIFMEM